MSEINLDSLKSIVEILSFAVGGFWFITNLKYQINSIIAQHKVEFENTNVRFKEIEQQLQELIKATVQLARQEERLNAQDQRLQELSSRIESVRESKLKTVTINNAAQKRARKSA